MNSDGKKPVVKLEQWYIEGEMVIGRPINHPNLPPEDCSRTETIVKNGQPTFVETASTLYLLGEPKPKKVR